MSFSVEAVAGDVAGSAKPRWFLFSENTHAEQHGEQGVKPPGRCHDGYEMEKGKV